LDEESEDHVSNVENATKQDKAITIIVNGRPKTVDKNAQLSFSAIVELAFPAGQQNSNTAFTVSYAKGDDKKPQGTLVEGESVKVKDGMVFNVTATDKS
jgi:hypothetical protein